MIFRSEVQVGKDSVFKGLATGWFTTLQGVYGKHKLDLLVVVDDVVVLCFFSFSLFFPRGRKSRGLGNDLGGL